MKNKIIKVKKLLFNVQTLILDALSSIHCGKALVVAVDFSQVQACYLNLLLMLFEVSSTVSVRVTVSCVHRVRQCYTDSRACYILIFL